MPVEPKPLVTGIAVAAVACVALAVVSFSRPANAHRDGRCRLRAPGPVRVRGERRADGRVPGRSRRHRRAGLPAARAPAARHVHLRARVGASGPRGRTDRAGRADQRRPRLGARPAAGGGAAVRRRRRNRLGRPRPSADPADRGRGPDLTGSGQTAYTVAVLPRVDVAGKVGTEAVDATFAPALSFDAADLRLQPSLQESEGVGPFAPREPGTGTRSAPAEVALGPLSLSVATARRVSLLGIAALLLLGGLLLASGRRRPAGDEHERIRARHGRLLLPVSSRSGELGARDRARRHGRARARGRAPGEADSSARRGRRALVRGRGRRDGLPLPRARSGARDRDRVAARARAMPAPGDEALQARALRRRRSGVRTGADLGARGDELGARLARRARRQRDHGRPEEAEAGVQRDHRHRRSSRAAPTAATPTTSSSGRPRRTTRSAG